ncbi:MAG TPA: 6-phosphogluconolactonase [Solirubrobacteraceae bacterium]|nr:6-phosphogluconolactonase [Solirubrobacteraceae bacterium]
MRRTRVVDDPAVVTAEQIAATADAGGQIVLAGGATPRAAYELAAELDADWSRATLWFGDERCVAPDDERSNFAMVKAALLDRLAGSAPTVMRIEGERGPDAAANAYEDRLNEAFDGGEPRFDLILLGLGPDLHTASLFPGKPAVEERERWVVGVAEAGMEPYVPRVTLTLPALNAGREVVFLIAGEAKADAVARAFGRDPQPDAPASLVAPHSGTVTLLLDSAAASQLEGVRA